MDRHKWLRRAAAISVIAISFAQSMAEVSAFTPENNQPPAANGEKKPEQAQPSNPLNVPQEPGSLPKDNNSTEIKIPGFGSVGSIPKFDFGLELLYGPKETPVPVGPPVDPRAPESDVQIKGTLTHKF